jgi:hypothetical protein
MVHRISAGSGVLSLLKLAGFSLGMRAASSVSASRAFVESYSVNFGKWPSRQPMLAPQALKDWLYSPGKSCVSPIGLVLEL